MKLYEMIEKTISTGVECNKNGRIIEHDFGQVYKGDLCEQWHTSFKNKTDFELRHWGTPIAVVSLNNGIFDKLKDAYISSRSDADAIQQLFGFLGLSYSAHYYPSTDRGTVVNEETKEVVFDC